MDVRSSPADPGSRTANSSAPVEQQADALAHARLADVFEQTPSFMAVLRGPQHVFELANDRYRQLVGHRELIGRAVREAFPDLAGQGFFELLDGVYASGEPFVGRDVRVVFRPVADRPPEERYLEFVYQPLRDPDGSVSGILAHGIDLTERKRYEARLRESEERLRAAFDQSIVGMVLSDLQGRIVRANDAFCRMVGRAPDELIGCDSSAFTHADDREQNVDYIRRLEMAEVGSAVYEKRYLRPDGATVWAQINLSPVRDGAGALSGLIAVVEDVTGRKRRAARDAFLLALDDAVRPLDDPGEITRTSARLLAGQLAADRCVYAEIGEDQDAFDVAGYYTAAGGGGDVTNLAGRYRLGDFGPEIVRLHRAGEPFVSSDTETDPAAGGAAQGTYRRGRIRAVVSVPLMKNGRLVAVVGVQQSAPRAWAADEVELVRDVANRCWESIERARVARDLRARESEFRQLADAMPQIVFMATPDGHVDYFNRRWYEYTGLPEGSVGIESWRHVHTEEGLRRVSEVWPEALRTGRPYQIEYPLRRHDGQFRWHLGRALPVHDERGRIVRWFGTNTDIHDQRELLRRNEELLDAERAARAEAERVSRMKDEFLATLSHELRTPLNAILGWSQILHTTLPADAEGDLREGLEIIERNARAQTQIIEDLLDMGRIISGKVRLDVRPIGLAGVVNAAIETVRPAADAKGVRIQAALAGPEPTVSGDPGRLQQVFWNLLSNAVKFTPGGGSVRVSLARVGGQVEVAVSDTGEGIRPEFLPHVFDRFRQADASTTRRHGGLGLGLAIVKQLTELHGGRVAVASPGLGRGTTFTVTLPLGGSGAGVGSPEEGSSRYSAAPAGNAPSYADSVMPPLDGLRVLVVDDEADARALLRRLLEECRATVRQAESAAAAMEQFRAEVPDVLISDIGMPGEDGYSLIKRVRALPAEQGGHVPAIALTAYARAEDRVRAVLAGFQAHIPKPVEPTELIATVASLAGLAR